jgi:Putative MetA-pathway of phenol degradation
VKRERKAAFLLLALCTSVPLCRPQGLSPRAYVVPPGRSNAITFTYSLQDGDVVFDPSFPIQNAHGRIGNLLGTYYRALDFFGRSANASLTLPYGVGHFEGEILGTEQQVYRSGLGGLTGRFSVNLYGAPAMSLKEYAKWRQKLLVGASLIVMTPTGQYNPGRLINIGSNRWAFKPEIGLSRRWGNWVLDAYWAIWFFTPNDNFFSNLPGSSPPNKQTQEPMGATELHLSYNIKPRLWMSVDGNYWRGGETSVNGKVTPSTLQANSRLGTTASFPVTKHQSIKVSYSGGTYITFGGNFQNLQVAWQYSWIDRSK